MTAEMRERIARLEEEVKDIPEMKRELEALKRFRVTVTTLWAATLGLVGFFGEKIKKAMGL